MRVRGITKHEGEEFMHTIKVNTRRIQADRIGV